MNLETVAPDRLGASNESFGTVIAPDTVRFQWQLPGSVDRVWAYLTEPDLRAKWFAAGEMELRPGGRVELQFNHASLTPHIEPVPEKYLADVEDSTCLGMITSYEPPRRLGFLWSEPACDSEVIFELAEHAGGVLLTLTHSRLASRGMLVGVAAGWHTHLSILADNLADRAPRPFWSTQERVEDEYNRLIPPG